MKQFSHILKHAFTLILVSIVLSLVQNCSPRKVDNTITKNSTATKTQEQSSNESSNVVNDDTKIAKEAKATYKIVDSTYVIGNTKFNLNTLTNELSITIEPADKNTKADYDVDFNGQKLKGSTTAKITYSTKSKQSNDNSEIQQSTKASKSDSSEITLSNTITNNSTTKSTNNYNSTKVVDSKTSFFEKTKNTIKQEPILLYLAIILLIVIVIYFGKKWLFPKP